MATIIRRSGQDGDPRLPREPFPEPGVQPMNRLSVLAMKEQAGVEIAAVPDAEPTGERFTKASGDAVPYRLLGNGVPVFDFDTTSHTASSPRNPTMYLPEGSRVPVKTLIVVGRLERLPTYDASGSYAERYGFMLRSGPSGNSSLFVRASNDPAGNGGTLGAFGGVNTGTQLVGPQVEIDGRLHFFAVVFNEANSALYYDASVVKGTMNVAQHRGFYAGNSRSGMRFMMTEAVQYDVALTPAQIAQKRAHYRALYQF